MNKSLKRESVWIHELQTVKPFGLNEELNLSCFSKVHIGFLFYFLDNLFLVAVD